MTEPAPVTPPFSYTTAKDGCTACGSQDTVTLDGHHGRRCGSHPPGFSPDKAVRLMVAGHADEALDYVRAAEYKQPCPVCRVEVTVLEGGRLAFHYQAPGLGSPCPGALAEDGAA